MKVIDLTLTISENIPTFPGSPQPNFINWESIEKDGYNLELLFFSSHTGTHIDAPWHFSEKGAKMDSISLETLMGEVFVIEALGVSVIDKDFLSKKRFPRKCKRVIFKTSNSSEVIQVEQFNKKFVALSSGGAQYLVDMGIELVGVDGPSVQLFHDDNQTHEILLGNGVVILEGLNLHDVPSGSYRLLALPLHIPNAEGAPARVLLTKGRI